MKALAGWRPACALALFAGALLVPIPPCRADLITPPPSSLPSAPEAARESVEARMAALGLTVDESRTRLAALDEREVATLADSPELLQVAGNGIGLGLILIGVGVVLFVLLWLIGTEKIAL